MSAPRAPALALAAALPLPLASLPPFCFGQWEKAEPLVVWFHAAAALAALAVVRALWRDPAASARVAHPFVLLPLALGLWSAAAAPFCELPWLSLLGAPQSGYGALWFLDTAAFVACALLAAEDEQGWALLVRLAMAVTTVVAALKGWDWFSLHQGGRPLLILVPAYYGWPALALPVAAGGRLRWPALAVATAAALTSGSLAVIGLLAAGCAFVALRRAPVGRTAAMGAVVVAAVLPLAALQAVPALRAMASLDDRWLLQRMMGAALAADPEALALGHGWGRTQDAFHTWLNLSGQRLWQPDWIFLSSDYFHSHNWAVETLYAAGVPGLALALAGFAAIPVFARAERRVPALALAAALAVLHGLWFPLCLSVPLVALALAAVADRSRLSVPGRGAAVAAAALGLGQAAAAAALLAYGLAMGAARTDLAASPPRPPALPADFRGSDLAVAEAIADFVVRADSEPGAPLAAAMPPLLDFIDRRAARTPTVLLLTAGLAVMARTELTGEIPLPPSEARRIMWRRWLDRLLRLAPGRSDQAIPYLVAAVGGRRWAEVDAVTGIVLAHDPGDPVGLHFRGLALLARGGDLNDGLALIRGAVDHGLERFMQLDAGIKALLGPQLKR